MNRDTAEQAILTSALVMAIIYGYRRLDEAAQPGLTLPRLVGSGAPVSFSAWATAWGTVFFMLAIVSEVMPGPAAAFSILTATSDVLVNGKQLFADLGANTGTSSSSTTAPKSSTATKAP